MHRLRIASNKLTELGPAIQFYNILIFAYVRCDWPVTVFISSYANTVGTTHFAVLFYKSNRK